MKRKRMLFGGAVVVALLLALIATLGLTAGDDDLPDGVFFRDDFSDVAEHWSLDSYRGITTDIRGGGYHVELSHRNLAAHEGASFDEGNEHEAVTVSASARFDSTATGGAVGLTCGYAPGDAESITGLFGRYQAEIGLDGEARIIRILNDDEVVLDERPAPGSLDDNARNLLELTCDYSGETANVTFDVNGGRAISVRDAEPFDSFESAGMYASTKGAGLEVVFDYLQAEQPNG